MAVLVFISACTQAPPTTDSETPNENTYSSARHDFHLVTVAEQLDHPWSMAWLPTGEMLVTERPGRLRIIRDGQLEVEPVNGLPGVYSEDGQGGFMDVVVHPQFDENRFLYLSYGKPNADSTEGATTVIRGRLQENHVADVEEIFEADAWGDNDNHFSGRMTFDDEGFLFIAVGDRMVDPDLMVEHPAQSLSDHRGGYNSSS